MQRKQFLGKQPKERKSILINQNGYLIQYNYCTTCGIVRPPRAGHCSKCNNCVEGLDHHCDWVGNCIGNHNYLYYFFFLLMFLILTCYILAFSLYRIIHETKNKKQNKISLSLCFCIFDCLNVIYTFIILSFILPLFFFHLSICTKGEKSREVYKKKYKNPFKNPYKRECKENIKNILCPKKKKSINKILPYSFEKVKTELDHYVPPVEEPKVIRQENSNFRKKKSENLFIPRTYVEISNNCIEGELVSSERKEILDTISVKLTH